MDNRPTCAVIILTQGAMRAELALSTVSWARNDTWHMVLGVRESKPTSDNRNRICAEALRMEQHPDVLMMIDEDILPRRCPAPLVRQMAEPGSPYDVIGLLCPTWRPDRSTATPIRWAVHNVDQDGKLASVSFDTGEALVEVDRVGTGAILIRREVLEHPAMRAPFADAFDDDGFRSVGHDYHFCDRAKRAGFRIWVATAYVCGHARKIELLDVVRMQQTQTAAVGVMPEWAAS